MRVYNNVFSGQSVSQIFIYFYGISAGVGVEPGTVVVAEEGLNGKLEQFFDNAQRVVLRYIKSQLEKAVE